MGIDHDRACDIVWNEIKLIENKNADKLLEDLRLIKDLKNEYINSISDVWYQRDKIVYITDFCAGGSIRKYLKKIGELQKLKVIKSWIIMLLKGLEYLHSKGLIFRDLNCGRIYYNSSTGCVFIGDLFVCSSAFYDYFEVKEYEAFLPYCMSPELIAHNKATVKSDIYSLGMVILEMVTMDCPYINNLKKKNINFFINGQTNICYILDMIIGGETPLSLKRIPDMEEIKNFITELTNQNPSERPSIESLLNHDFLIMNKESKDKDNRTISLNKLKKLKKKNRNKQMHDFLHSDEENKNKKQNFKLHKKCFIEDPYFDESRVQNMTDSHIMQNLSLQNTKFKYSVQALNNQYGQYTGYTGDRHTLTHTQTANNTEFNHHQESMEVPDSETLQIFDAQYNIHVKFLINQEGKLHEVQFTYNLLKDNIKSLMEEIRREFNFSVGNLNRIYEELKKINLYAKLTKSSEIIPDNSF